MRYRFSPFVTEALATKRRLFDFLAPGSMYARHQNDPGVCDFAWGNPHDMPLPQLVDVLKTNAEPQNKDWYAYRIAWPEAEAVVARTLHERTGLAYEDADVILTNGSFGALAVTLRALSGPGDEVLFMSPPWFNYESMIAAAGAMPVKLYIRPDDFNLDLGAIEAAVSERTAVVIINSPHNPTGKIYPRETLERLSEILTAASKRHGRIITLLADESYNRIVFDGREFVSPAQAYPHTLVSYTYGKTLLAPGARLGYLAITPGMPERKTLKEMIRASQLASGWAFPDNLMMYSLEKLEGFSIDVAHLQWRRDRVVAALQEYGYRLHVPEGTFYLVVQSPLDDDWAFCETLAGLGVLVMPGTIFDMPGYFRISLTASDDMIERGLPRFRAVMEETRKKAG